jgi:gluconokinase
MLTCIILMGVSGCGKSSLLEALKNYYLSSERLTGAKVVFFEGDDFHSAENRLKLSSGIPLTDGDRMPWLKSLTDAILAACCSDENEKYLAFATCSALKKSYRDFIRSTLKEIRFIYLKIGNSNNVLKQRLDSRVGHFASTAIMESQLQILEEPSELEENVTTIDCCEHDVSSLAALVIKSIAFYSRLLLSPCSKG